MKGRGGENTRCRAEKKSMGGRGHRAGREWKGRRLASKAKEARAGE